MNHNQKGAVGVLEIALIAVVIGIIGFTAWRVVDGNKGINVARQDSVEEVEQSELLPIDLGDVKSLGEIQAIALASAGDSTIVGIELETEDGVTYYSVHFSDGVVLFYNASTGEVIAKTDDNDDTFNSDESIPNGFVAEVTIQEAISIARAQRPDSQLEKVELELEDGVVVYSVRFTDDSRVDVNAVNGVVQRLKDETGTDIIKLDDDFDDDGIDNSVDDDDDNDGVKDDQDDDDDNDGINDDEDVDDDNDGMDDDEDEDDDESGSNNSGSGNNN